jgi:CDGSH-type Zn-finger protein
MSNENSADLSTLAVRASDCPYAVDVEAGRTYWWCACGKSRSQPFCDGSHAGTVLEPVRFDAVRDEKVWFCGCKATAAAPVCDGSHNSR